MGSQNPVVRLVLASLMGGYVMSMLAKNGIGWWLVLFGTAFLVVCAVTIYLNRYEQTMLRRGHRYPGARQLINAACAVTGEQPPDRVAETAERSGGGPTEPGVEAAEASTYSVLRDAADFERAAELVRGKVVGHDRTVDAIVDDLRRAVMVRIKRPDGGGTPLGTYLIGGPAGVGKGLMAIAIGRQLYPEGGILVLDGREYADPAVGIADLFGGPAGAGRLLNAVREQPLHVVVLECVDSAHADVLDRLTAVLQHGEDFDPASGARISFEHCVFFLNGTRIGRVLRLIADERGAEGWRERAIERLSTELGMPRAFLECVHVIDTVESLAAMDRARVIAALLEHECARYRVELDWIDPAILADEVAKVTDARGFQGVHARVRNLLRDDLARAVEISMPRLSLRERRPAASPPHPDAVIESRPFSAVLPVD